MKKFTIDYFENLLTAAAHSERLRMHENLHNSFSDPCQKLFNAICPNSYIRPHRHLLDPKDETLIAIKGLFGLFIFSDEGSLQSIELFGSQDYSEKYSIAFGVEVPSSAWHTVISLVEKSILFEVKSGPFNPHLSKEYARWAPEEGSSLAHEYNQNLRNTALGKLHLN